MKKIQIIKDGKKLDSFIAPTEAELFDWLEPRISHKVFGAEAYSYQELVSEEVSEVKEIQIVKETRIDEETQEEVEVEIEVEVVVQEYQPAVYRTVEVPAEYSYEITDITAELEAQQIQAQKDAMREMIKSRCQKALDEIMNFNLTSDFSIEQIDQLEVEFGEVHSALSKYRIDKAAALLSIAPESELIPQSFINKLLQILVG